MTKPRKDVKINRDGSPTATRNGAKTTGRNGSFDRLERPEYERHDTTASGWATENEGDETSQPQVPALSDFEKKKQTFITRAIWTLVMIAVFFGAMFAGHIYVIIIVTAVQIISFKEVIAIANVPSRARSLRFTKTLNWYFLGSAMYFLYGESVIYYFKHIVLIDRVLLPFATHHRFISFMLYVMGFVFFVGSLQKGHYRFQSGENVGAKVINRANEIFRAHEQVGKAESDENGANPSANKAYITVS